MDSDSVKQIAKKSGIGLARIPNREGRRKKKRATLDELPEHSIFMGQDACIEGVWYRVKKRSRREVVLELLPVGVHADD